MLESYWPAEQEVNACIKNEAETANDSVLLAVHQPTKFTTREENTNIEQAASEDELLRAFLSSDVPGGYLLFPITGPSGIGKSHVIRWLDAQLRRSDRSDELHIIRIPKSASLRKVVQLILEPLAGDPRFERSRTELTKAVSEINREEAVVRFRAEIENALNRLVKQMMADLKKGDARSEELKLRIGHAKQLPKLFLDGALSEHFDEKVLSRVLARALEGFGEGDEGKELESQFFEKDLIIPDDVDLDGASYIVRNYYQTQLASVEGTGREIATDLLNEIRDSAIGNVFQLEQNTGGVTLQEIILGVREILFNKGKNSKELILLVEDFAALSGIQDTLLNVCIQEGVEAGKQVRATMRTAIALTDGFLTSRDTILTRAQRVWVIGDRNRGDEAVRADVIEMVGSYLNASRWGEKELEAKFRTKGSGTGLTGWLPNWESDALGDHESDALKAFGYSNCDHALFPFNQVAIEKMADYHLKVGGNLIFNPRRVINHILRPVLLLRQQFLRGEFPVSNLHPEIPNAYLAQLLSNAGLEQSKKERMAMALVVWGGNARNDEDLSHVNPEIFKAFSLPVPSELAEIEFDPTPRPNRAPDTPKPTPREAGKEDEHIAEWSLVIEAWANGRQLEQRYSRELRNALFGLLEDAVDWNVLRLKKREIKPAWLDIANAHGNPTGGKRLIVCEDHQDPNGRLRAAFKGAIRHKANASGWAYPDATEDYIACSEIIEHLLPQLRSLLLEEAQDHSAILCNTLLNQARILGLAPPIGTGKADLGGIASALLAPIPEVEREPFHENWDRLIEKSSSESARKRTQEEFLALNACYRSSGGPQAIDITRIIESLKIHSSDLATPLDWGDDVKELVTHMRPKRLQRTLKKPIVELESFRTKTQDLVNQDFDKNQFVADLRETVELLGRTSLWPNNIEGAKRPSQFVDQLTEFQKSGIMDLFKKVAVAIEESDHGELPKLLNAMGSLNLDLVTRTLRFVENVERILTSAEASVPQKLQSLQDSDPKQIADKIAQSLQSISQMDSQN